MKLNKKLITDLLNKTNLDKSEMEIKEVEKDIIEVYLKLKLKDLQESENKKKMDRAEFYKWAEKFETRIFSELNRINSRLDNLEKDVSILKKDVQSIKNCPTIKKELKLSK